MTIEPREDRVLIKPDKGPDSYQTPTLKLEMVASAQKAYKPFRGTVIATGPGKDKPMDLKEKDRVIFGRYAGTNISDDDKEPLLIMRSADIFARIFDNPKEETPVNDSAA